MLKQAARQISDAVIAGLRPHWWQRGVDDLLVLTYHRVLPRSYENLDLVEPGMYVHPDTFEMHLRQLQRNFELVHLGAWVQGDYSTKARRKPACAVTFDDGWRDNYLYAFPLLEKYSIPVTMFVVSNFVGTGHQFWSDRLARILRQHSLGIYRDHRATEAVRWLDKLFVSSGVAGDVLSSDKISQLIAVAKRHDDIEIGEHLDTIDELDGIAGLQSNSDFVNWTDVDEMSKSGLVEFGSHTQNHVRLMGNVAKSDVVSEVVQSKLDIENRIGTPVVLFCYPNGDYCDESEAIVSSAYEGACTVQSGWHGKSDNPHRIQRITIHEGRTASKLGFLARLSGWL